MKAESVKHGVVRGLEAVLFFLVAMILFGIVTKAHAEGGLICTVAVTSTAVDTFQPFTDGGTNCAWARGSTVAMQCPGAEVCYDPTALPRLADGGEDDLTTYYLNYDGGRGILNPDGGVSLDDGGTAVTSLTRRSTTATTGNLCVNFTINPDPYLISLSPMERNISLILNANSDGGSVVQCKMAKTERKPQQ